MIGKTQLFSNCESVNPEDSNELTLRLRICNLYESPSDLYQLINKDSVIYFPKFFPCITPFSIAGI